MRRVLSLMIGELNSSHTGIVAGQDAARPPVTGRLGIALDPSDNDIVSVTPLGPADVAGIKAGEKLISIDGIPLSPQTNLDELLQHKIGKRTICRTSAHENAVVLPVNQNTLSDSEDFTEGYRAVKLGKVVGTPTAAGSFTPARRISSMAQRCGRPASESQAPAVPTWSCIRGLWTSRRNGPSAKATLAAMRNWKQP